MVNDSQNGGPRPPEPEENSSGNSSLLNVYEKIQELSENQPEVKEELEALIEETRAGFKKMKQLLDEVNPRQRKLIAFFLLNGIHQAANEILIGQPGNEER